MAATFIILDLSIKYAAELTREERRSNPRWRFSCNPKKQFQYPKDRERLDSSRNLLNWVGYSRLIDIGWQSRSVPDSFYTLTFKSQRRTTDLILVFVAPPISSIGGGVIAERQCFNPMDALNGIFHSIAAKLKFSIAFHRRQRPILALLHHGDSH
jgi:hypothetical protein